MRLLCYLGIHDWLINKWVKYKTFKSQNVQEEGFDRTCQRCGKEQRLQRPEKYHPSKYVWTDLTQED